MITASMVIGRLGRQPGECASIRAGELGTILGVVGTRDFRRVLVSGEDAASDGGRTTSKKSIRTGQISEIDMIDRRERDPSICIP
jgi:hypothetical protein